MREQSVSYDIGDKTFDLFAAGPDAAGPHPVVMICHAWGGRSAFEEDKARALASLGYIGAAVDLYGVGERGTDKASSQALMGRLTGNPALLRTRLQAAFDTAMGLEGADPARAGVIGFCFGGLCALLMARMGLSLRATVSFHGLLKVGESLGNDIAGRVLVLHGQDDPMVPAEDIGAFSAEMARCHADWQLRAYPHTVHAFTNPAAQDPGFGTVYNQDADRRSWAEMRALFDEVFAA